MDRGQTFFFHWMEPRYFFHTWSRPEYFFWPKPEPEYFFQKKPRPPPGSLMVAPLTKITCLSSRELTGGQGGRCETQNSMALNMIMTNQMLI